MILADPTNRTDWLRCRSQGIGGSDASCIVGANPYKSNVKLWREKVGIDVPEDIGMKPAVYFGKHAEEPVRDIFMLMHPGYKLEYHEFRMYAADDAPFMFATLDGELTDEVGKRGIYEGKTATIQNNLQWDEWTDRIPQGYYIQILHQMLCCEWAEYVVLNAFIRYGIAADKAKMQSYTVFREDVVDDMEWLKEQEREFWQCVQDKREPALKLPEI